MAGHSPQFTPGGLPDNCETHCVSGNWTHDLPIVSLTRYQLCHRDFSNYSDSVDGPSILWVYQLNLEETKTNHSAPSSVQVEDPWRQWAGTIGAARVVFRDIIVRMKLHCASVSHFRTSHFTQLPFRKLRRPPYWPFVFYQLIIVHLFVNFTSKY